MLCEQWTFELHCIILYEETKKNKQKYWNQTVNVEFIFWTYRKCVYWVQCIKEFTFYIYKTTLFKHIIII